MKMNRRVSKLMRKVFIMTMSAVMVFETVNCSAIVAEAAEAYFYIKTDGEPTDEKHPINFPVAKWEVLPRILLTRIQMRTIS